MFSVASSCISRPLNMLSRRITCTSRQRRCITSCPSSENTSTTKRSGGKDSKFVDGMAILSRTGQRGPDTLRRTSYPECCKEHARFHLLRRERGFKKGKKTLASGDFRDRE